MHVVHCDQKEDILACSLLVQHQELSETDYKEGSSVFSSVWSYGLIAFANVRPKGDKMIDAWLRRYWMFRKIRNIVEQGLLHVIQGC
jgi:hypothetical protein